jgi:hypothetical protein
MASSSQWPNLIKGIFKFQGGACGLKKVKLRPADLFVQKETHQERKKKKRPLPLGAYVNSAGLCKIKREETYGIHSHAKRVERKGEIGVS